MINLSLYALRQLAKGRNISDYENKSEEDSEKALIETKPEKKTETKPKSEIKPETKPKETLKQIPKPQTKPKPEARQIPKPETKPKPEPEPKIQAKVYKRRLKKLIKNFDELRHKFSKEEIKKFRKAFYVAKNKKYLSESEIKKTNKNINTLKKSLKFKTFRGNIDSVDYDDLDYYDYDYDFTDDDEYKKIGSVRTLFKEFDRNYYIEYKSKADRYENLSPKEYINLIRSYLGDLINDHKPIDEPTDKSNDDDIDRAEWKI